MLGSVTIMKRYSYPPALVIVWLIVLCGQASNPAEIVEAPTNQTAPVNSTAIFRCRVTGILRWEFEGVQLVDATTRDDFCRERGVCVNVTLDNSPNETESLLLVAAIEANNNGEIKCLVSETVTSRPEESKVAVLKIFDRPEPPTNLVFLPLSHLHLNLSWNAPFIFPGTKISYTVTIRNVNTSEEIQRKGLEVTYYIFSGTEGSSMCDVYQFSVVAVNGAGKSDPSESISSHLPSLPNIEASVENLKHDVMFENGSTVALITISFEPAGTCGGDLDAVTGYDITLDGDSTNVTVRESHDGDGRVNFEIANVEVNFQYTFRIVAFNSVGNTTSEESDCYTTDVQHASISMRESDTVVTCFFAQGSQARGCQIRLNSPMENLALNIARLNASGIVIEPSYSLTCYDICALDWEADGTIGELCVPVTVTLSQFASCGENITSPLTDNITPLVTDKSNAEPSKSLIIIIAGVVGGVGLCIFLGVLAVVAVVIRRCCHTRGHYQVNFRNGMQMEERNGNRSRAEHGQSTTATPHTGEVQNGGTETKEKHDIHSTIENSGSHATTSHTHDEVQHCHKKVVEGNDHRSTIENSGSHTYDEVHKQPEEMNDNLSTIVYSDFHSATLHMYEEVPNRRKQTEERNGNHSTIENSDSRATTPHTYFEVEPNCSEQVEESDDDHSMMVVHSDSTTPHVYEEVPNCSKQAKERNDNLSTMEQSESHTATLHMYEELLNCNKQGDRESGELNYSRLNRSCQPSSTARVEFKQEPQYSTLDSQVPVYEELESSSKPHGIPTGNQEVHCERDDKISSSSPMNYEGPTMSESESDTSMVPENEILYEQPTS